MGPVGLAGKIGSPQCHPLPLELTHAVSDAALRSRSNHVTDRLLGARPEPHQLGAALQTSGEARVSKHKLQAGDVEQLLTLIERTRTREAQRSGQVVQIRSCYEAGYDGFWLHRRLRASGIINVVVEPTSLQVDRRARRVKTDRIDADRLLRALMAHTRGDREVWRLV